MELAGDILEVALAAWAAAQDANSILVPDDLVPVAHVLAEAGWLARHFVDGELMWRWTGAADAALTLSSLTADMSERMN
jgi:hypothetical protein